MCWFLKLSEENQREKQRAQQLDIEVTRLRQEVTRKEQEKRALRTFDAVAINNICKLIVYLLNFCCIETELNRAETHLDFADRQLRAHKRASSPASSSSSVGALASQGARANSSGRQSGTSSQDQLESFYNLSLSYLDIPYASPSCLYMF